MGPSGKIRKTTAKSESQTDNMPRKSVTEKPIVVSTGAAAAAPARRKSPSPKRAARTVEVAETAATAVVTAPTQEDIARLAYSYWEARGCVGGSPEQDWLRAEQELRAAI
jgi:hypothetical protein